jgi:hypothetical protein
LRKQNEAAALAQAQTEAATRAPRRTGQIRNSVS